MQNILHRHNKIRTASKANIAFKAMALTIILFAVMSLMPVSAYKSFDISFTPTIAYADDKDSDGSYLNIDMSHIAQQDANSQDSDGGGSPIVQNSMSIIELLVNKILLPISIIVVIGRLMYIIIFPLMAGIDPFDVLDVDTFREGPQSILRKSTHGNNSDGSEDGTYGWKEYDWGGKGDWRVKLTQEQIVNIIKQELIGTGKMLLIIIIVWGVINFILWFAGYIAGNINF